MQGIWQMTVNSVGYHGAHGCTTEEPSISPVGGSIVGPSPPEMHVNSPTDSTGATQLHEPEHVQKGSMQNWNLGLSVKVPQD